MSRTACLDSKNGTEIDARKVIGVFCNNFLDKVANHFWTLLHVQIGQSCKGLGWQLNTSRITVADI